MPVSYAIDPDRRLVTSRAWGTVTSADIVDHVARLRADPGFDPTYRELIDLRATTTVDVAPVAFETVAQLRLFAPGSRRALVTSSLAQYGRARSFAALAAASAAQTMRVFLEPAPAKAWLGL